MSRIFVALFATWAGLVAATANANLVVYADASQNGFNQGCSFGGNAGDFDFANALPVRSGSASIRFTPDNYNAVSWCTPATYSATTDYAGIAFWVYLSNSAQGANLDLVLGYQANLVGASSLQSLYGSAVPANTWVEIQTSFATGPLNYTGNFDQISLQSETGTTQANVYFDDVSLSSPVNDEIFKNGFEGSALPPPACGMTDHHDQSVTPAPGDTMVSDVFDWCDSSSKPREAVLAHNDQTGATAGVYANHGGSLQQFSYQMPGGATRTATITTYGNGGYGGFGYVVSHSAWLSNGYCAGDDSPLGYSFSGTWTRVFEGRHHAIFRFQQNYQRHCGPNQNPPTTLVPVTIDWIFSTGRDNPLWAITYDMSAVTQNFLFDDSRAPYGELNIDGDGFSHDIDGVAWGDRYQFTSTTAPVTLSSAWTWATTNTVPYVKEWITASDATMGLVQTQTIDQQDAGGGRNPYYQDLTAYWGKTSANGNACPSGGYAMPCQDGWPYQANNDSIGVGVSNNNARLTWGTQYGFLGQTAYASNQTILPAPDNGPYLSGWPKKSYSVYVVLGPHSTLPVDAQRTQVETAQTLTLSASTGSVAGSGPAGVSRSDTITYDPPGYDPIYGALTFVAASNALDANIVVGSGTLTKPLIIVRSYTGSDYPAQVELNGSLLTIDVDYFPSLRADTQELWITLNRDLSGASNRLQIGAAAVPSAHWVDGYYPGYQSSTLPVAQVNFNDITHLMIGAILPNANGSIDTTFYLGSNGANWATSAIAAAHAAGRKAILMVGGAGEISGWEGAASSANRNTFVANLLGAVSSFGADGLDLDWEPITDADDASILALVQALRNSGPPGLILTMPVGAYNQNFPPGAGSGDATLFASLYPLLDQINLMSYGNAYDYSGWYSWFSSALAGEAGNYPIDIASSVGDLEGFGVPAAKLGVGIGAYGLCFKNVTQPRVAVSSGDIVSADDNTMTYAHIVSAYIPNMAYTYDATAKSPWLSHATAVGSPGCTYVTYEDPTSIADKGAWALAHGLGGTIVWTIAEGHVGNGNDPLLDAAHAAFP
jgi:hypothetical protein